MSKLSDEAVTSFLRRTLAVVLWNLNPAVLRMSLILAAPNSAPEMPFPLTTTVLGLALLRNGLGDVVVKPPPMCFFVRDWPMKRLSLVESWALWN